MSDYTEDELLEYETGAEEPDEAAVKVCIEDPVVTVETVSQFLNTFTIVVDSDDAQFLELLPYDPLRSRALIIVNDQPVVLCDSRSQANQPGNQVANVPNPVGAFVYASATVSTPVELKTTAQVFVAATTTDPARVSVFVERRS